MKSPDLGVRVEVRGDGDGALDGGDGAGARPAPLQLPHHRRKPQLKATKSQNISSKRLLNLHIVRLNHFIPRTANIATT